MVAALARDLGIHARIKNLMGGKGTSYEDPVGSVVVTLAREEASLAPLEKMEGWRKLTDRKVEPWTDDFSNIVTALWRRYVG